MNHRLLRDFFTCLLLACAGALACFAQSGGSGSLQGTVTDPTGAIIAGATVSIDNPVSHYSRTMSSDAQGKFGFSNIPYNHYHLTVKAAGFQNAVQDVDVRTAVPMALTISMTLGTATESVTVEAGADLVEA